MPTKTISFTTRPELFDDTVQPAGWKVDITSTAGFTYTQILNPEERTFAIDLGPGEYTVQVARLDVDFVVLGISSTVFLVAVPAKITIELPDVITVA